MAVTINTATVANDEHIRGTVSAEEWAVRVDLAAAYRLVALYGWDDLIFTHLSARVPGSCATTARWRSVRMSETVSFGSTFLSGPATHR